MSLAAFPGSFDPLTIAHLAIAEAVLEHHAVDRLDLVLSRVALAKEGGGHESVEDRAAALTARTRTMDRLGVRVTDAQLLVDIAEGYDLLVLGADKWHQIHDPRFYGGSTRRRDEAIARLPALVVAPRASVEIPADLPAQVLHLPGHLHHVSSTGVRDGREEWRA